MAHVTANEPSPTAKPTGWSIPSGYLRRPGCPARLSPEDTGHDRRGATPGTHDVGAGKQVTQVVAGDIGTATRRRFGPDKDEHRRTRQRQNRWRGVLLQGNRLNAMIPLHGFDLGLLVNDDVGRGGSADRDTRTCPIPACDGSADGPLASDGIGQEHRGLSGRVAAADNADVGTVVKVGFHRCASIVDAGAGKTVCSRGFQLATGAQGQSALPGSESRRRNPRRACAARRRIVRA